MESKYYTPKIEEFHVGFEYEALFTDKKKEPNLRWVKMNEPFQFKRLYEWLELPEPGLRVKYLDKEDIESLGFKQLDRVNTSRYIKNDVSIWLGDVNKGILTKIEVRDRLRAGVVTRLFIGTIKNKSVF